MKKNVVLLSLPVILFTSCTSSETPKQAMFPSRELTIDTFSTLPAEIEGAGCYYAKNKADFESGKYIYAEGYDNAAYMTINGVLTKMKDSTGKDISDYEVTIDTTEVRKVDYTTYYKGQLKLESKAGSVVTYSIYGLCGC